MLARDLGIAVWDYRHALRFRASSAREWRPPPSLAAGTARPVVLLPGVFETWHYLRPVAERLAAAGHPVHALPELGFTTAPIPDLAERAARAIAERDLADVALVAHSKGGLVGKELMVRHDPDGRIARLIAIATPFAGSSRSAWMPLPPLRAFRPSDPVIARLRDATAADARIVSIYPEIDPHIPEGSAVAGAVNLQIATRGHFRVLLEAETVGAVIAEAGR